VLHVSGGDVYGGIERMVATLATTDAPGLRQSVVVSPSNRLFTELTGAGVDVAPLPFARASRPLSVMRGRRAFAALLDRMRPDAVVFHGSWTHAMFAVAARAQGAAVVFWQHAPILTPGWLDRWAARTSPDLQITNSRFTASAPAFRQMPSHVVHCAVSPRRTSDAADRQVTRAALGVSPSDVVILMAARFEAWKGHAVLIEAARLLRSAGFRFWIAGGVQRPSERAYAGELQAQVADAGLQGAVAFLGQRADVPALMSAADLYCQPNTAPEPFGIAIAEAMLAGMPCVVSKSGGAMELVDERCGWLTEPRDAPAVARAIERLAKDVSARGLMGRAAAARAAELTNPHGRLDELLRLLASRSAHAAGPVAQPFRAAPAMPVSAPPNHHVVYVTTSGALGGAETSLLTLLASLRELEPAWRFTVIAPAAGRLLERSLAAGADTAVLPFPPAIASLGEPRPGALRAAARARAAWRLLAAAAALPLYLRRLRRELRRRQPTIVHTMGIKAHVAAALALPGGVRLVWHLHEYVSPRPATARLLRVLAGHASAIVANSDSVAEDASRVLMDRRPRRIHNAVDLRTFSPEGPVLDLAGLSGLAPDHGRIRIGLVATFGRWKGHEVFLQAIARLLPSATVRAYVIGGSVYQTDASQRSLAELERMARDLGIAGCVGFPGHVDDVAAALRALDIVVHASTSPEPFGMVIAEAMAAGRAVVAVAAGGSQELFEDGVDALGHRIGDATDLADRLSCLVQDARLRASLGAAARASAVRRFPPRRMAEEFRAAYLA
jgi:glycosyltransferase involved in cell wall biosynthesis